MGVHYTPTMLAQVCTMHDNDNTLFHSIFFDKNKHHYFCNHLRQYIHKILVLELV